MTKETFKKFIKTGSGHLADKAKREEYAKLMANKPPRRPKPTGFTETKAN